MPNDPATAPWRIDYHACPKPLPDRLRFLISYAILAPSTLNIQPWHFRTGESHIDILADRSRALPVIDPHDRELTISCAAAAFNIAIAARYFNHETVIEVLPEPKLPELIARVHIAGDRQHDRDDKALFSAITRRRTTRLPFKRDEIDRVLIQKLDSAVSEEGAWLHIVHDRRARHAVADLISEGDRAQHHDKCFRRELAAWVHPNRSRSRDGLPGSALGLSDLTSTLAPIMIRTFPMANKAAAHDADLVEHSPILAIIGTETDTPRDWVHAGLALEHVLLLCTSTGLTSSFLNQPIEVDELRPRLAKLLGRHDHPQILLRLGFGPDVAPTPRRPVEEVIVP